MQCHQEDHRLTSVELRRIWSQSFPARSCTDEDLICHSPVRNWYFRKERSAQCTCNPRQNLDFKSVTSKVCQLFSATTIEVRIALLKPQHIPTLLSSIKPKLKQLF